MKTKMGFATLTKTVLPMERFEMAKEMEIAMEQEKDVDRVKEKTL
jgi:hypothetical protein